MAGGRHRCGERGGGGGGGGVAIEWVRYHWGEEWASLVRGREAM